jgi:hypothetical protein
MPKTERFPNNSILNKREILAHDTLIWLAQRMRALPGPSRMKVYKRWLMLHLMTESELKQFDHWLERVGDDSGADRREA